MNTGIDSECADDDGQGEAKDMLDFLLQGFDPTPERSDSQEPVCCFVQVWAHWFREPTDETVDPPVGAVERHHHVTETTRPSGAPGRSDPRRPLP
jgi:hypothetical protein